jgi:hypothetical protein
MRVPVRARGRLAVSAAVIAAVTVGRPAHAQQSSCTVICAPQVALNVAGFRSHVLGSPTVRDDATGAETKLPSRTNLDLQLFVVAPTAVQHLYGYVSVSWLPSATTRQNPYTEYTASQVGEPIKANHLSLAVGGLVDLVPKTMTNGWGAVQGYVADLLSPAARPNDTKTFTHKLDLGGVAVFYPFAGMDSTSLARRSGIHLYVDLDYVATGLPKAGDDVPRGERTFVTGAKPAALIFGVGIPIAPLLQAK